MKVSNVIRGIIISLGRNSYAVCDLDRLCEPFGVGEGSLHAWLSQRLANSFLVLIRQNGRLEFWST